MQLISQMFPPVFTQLHAGIYKDFDRTIALCETLVQAGASMLTIHGRTREEKGQLVRAADWDMVARVERRIAALDIVRAFLRALAWTG
jgi:tRNA-dihydrouridine synthase